MNPQLYLFLLHPWSAISYFGNSCTDLTGNDCKTGLPQGAANSANLQNILQIVFAILAALSVLFIVIAGLRFITAQGNPQEVGKAKSTIVYALIGLLVALLAEAIVAFTLGKLG
jgi:hypothetical protein